MIQRIKTALRLVQDDDWSFEKDLIRSGNFSLSKEAINRRLKEHKREQILEQGYDHCSLCGDRIELDGVETWEGVKTRFKEHLQAREDHVLVNGNWHHVEDTE